MFNSSTAVSAPRAATRPRAHAELSAEVRFRLLPVFSSLSPCERLPVPAPGQTCRKTRARRAYENLQGISFSRCRIPQTVWTIGIGR